MEALPIRKQMRLREYDYSQNGAYFITICTAKREWVFGAIDDGTMILSDNGIVADNEIKKLSTHYLNVQITNHVVMPNHVHLIVAIMDVKATGAASGAPTVGNIIRGYKSGVSRLVGCSIWQRNYHDHIIRNEQDYIQIAQYIETNPINWKNDTFIASPYCTIHRNQSHQLEE